MHGVSGWSINKDGSAEFNNAVIRGLLQAGTVTAGSISASTIGSSTLTNDTILDTNIVIDGTGGTILVYATTGMTVQTITATGAGVFNVPAGITSVKVECWGGGGGGVEGQAPGHNGGTGGSGGEYACEPNYAVTPLAALNYTVGAAGVGDIGSGHGTDGGATTFDGSHVKANPGKGALASLARMAGGTGSANTIHFDGGASGIAGANKGGGGGGGSSGGSSQAGTQGSDSTSNVGAAGGIAPTGGGNGGNGGTVTGTGAAGVQPGGGGGGGSTGLAGSGGNGGAGQIKLTYGGTRTLIASISGTAGTDPYGNNYVAGVRTNISQLDNMAGGYYEELTFPQTTLTNSVLTTVKCNATTKLLSDFGSAYNQSTGVWTAPADGVYTITVGATSDPFTAAASRFFVGMNDNSNGNVYGRDERTVIAGTSPTVSLSFTRFFAKNTAMFCQAFQNSANVQHLIVGAAPLVPSYMSFERVA